MNELKYAGAEAISINDNRIINLTDIVTLNDSFIVMYNGSVEISSPFVVKAIGDKATLLSTLNTKNGSCSINGKYRIKNKSRRFIPEKIFNGMAKIEPTPQV